MRLNFLAFASYFLMTVIFFSPASWADISPEECSKKVIEKCEKLIPTPKDFGKCAFSVFLECEKDTVKKLQDLSEAEAALEANIWFEKTYAEYPLSIEAAAKICLGEYETIDSENIVPAVACLERWVHKPPVSDLGYCNKVASATGYRSESTYKTCLKQELSEKSKLDEIWSRVSDQSRAYCKKVASATGEMSYSTLLLCVEQELAAGQEK